MATIEEMNERAVIAQERIATALEALAETTRLSYEVSIDVAAKSNLLTDEMAGMFQGLVQGGLSGLFGGDNDVSPDEP